MNNNISSTQPDMQNWKKQIIMDPILNHLFDDTLSSTEFLNTKILTLQHDQIVNIYTKLASLKHSLSKSIQKQVSVKNNFIEQSFQSLHEFQASFSQQERTKLQNTLRYLEKFNQKYEVVESSLLKWKNITKCLEFSEALQAFLVDTRILKTLLKDFKNKQQDKQSINMLKVSKIIKQISQLCKKHDFSGIPFYELEKIFIKNVKDIVLNYTDKKFNILLNKSQFQQKDIKQKIIILHNINKLPQSIAGFYKNVLKELGENLKKAFCCENIQDFIQSIQRLFTKKVIQYSNAFVFLEQVMKSLNIFWSNVSSAPNLFEKMWDKLIQYSKDILKWSIQQDSKDKQRSRQKQIVWRYPALFQAFKKMSNQVHMLIITKTEYILYDFSGKKEQMMKSIIPLSNLYYEAINLQWQTVLNQIVNCQQKQSLNIALSKQSKIGELLNWNIETIQQPKILQNLNDITQKNLKKIREKCNKIYKQAQQYSNYNLFLLTIKQPFLKSTFFLVSNKTQVKYFDKVQMVQQVNNRQEQFSNAQS